MDQAQQNGVGGEAVGGLAIRVQSPQGPVEVLPFGVIPTAAGRVVSEAERQCKLNLRVARTYHTYSMAQVLGIWPA